MSKKVLTVLVAVLLIVAMGVCLVACSDADQGTTKKGSSFLANDGVNAKVVTKSIQINEKSSFDIATTEAMSATDVQSKVVVKDENGNVVPMNAVAVGDNKTFRVSPVANVSFVAGNWYDFEILDSKLSFVNYKDATKLSMYVQEGNSSATFNDNVTYLTGGSAYIDNFKTNGALKTFEFDSLAAGQTLSMGQIVLVEDIETGDYTAYQVLGVQASDRTGVYTISYASPNYEEVYDILESSDVAVLGKDGEVEIKEDAIQETISEQLSEAGFNIGVAKFDINANLDKDNQKVTIDITVKIPDMIGAKDGVNSLDLVLEFKIETKITVESEISIGALLAAKDNGIELLAKFDNTLTFGVKVEDTAAVADVSQLDAIIEKIANMLKGAEEDDISIDVFNWIIPIGNGIADINFDVNLDMNFNFSGELGVTSTSTASLTTRIFFNPSTEEKAFEIKDKDFSFDSVKVFLDGNAAAYIGIDAAIKFDLLGGVISVGVGAEVGNFNKVYGRVQDEIDLKTKDNSVIYGVYLEGGIYYDAKFLYNVAKLASGSISFLGGRQEKVLYTAGSKYVVTGLKETTMKLGTVAQDIAIDCTYVNIVDGTVVGNWTNIIEASKITEVSESNAEANYVEIKDGKIYLTEAGLNESFSNYYVIVKADNATAKIYIEKIASTETTVGGTASITIGKGKANVTAAYLDGTAAKFSYDVNSTAVVVTGEKAGTIVVYVNGEAVGLVSVA